MSSRILHYRTSPFKVICPFTFIKHLLNYFVYGHPAIWTFQKPLVYGHFEQVGNFRFLINVSIRMATLSSVTGRSARHGRVYRDQPQGAGQKRKIRRSCVSLFRRVFSYLIFFRSPLISRFPSTYEIYADRMSAWCLSLIINPPQTY